MAIYTRLTRRKLFSRLPTPVSKRTPHNNKAKIMDQKGLQVLPEIVLAEAGLCDAVVFSNKGKASFRQCLARSQTKDAILPSSKYIHVSKAENRVQILLQKKGWEIAGKD